MCVFWGFVRHEANMVLGAYLTLFENVINIGFFWMYVEHFLDICFVANELFYTTRTCVRDCDM